MTQKQQCSQITLKNCKGMVGRNSETAATADRCTPKLGLTGRSLREFKNKRTLVFKCHFSSRVVAARISSVTESRAESQQREYQNIK